MVSFAITQHKLVPRRLPICPTFRYFYSHALVMDLGLIATSTPTRVLNPELKKIEDVLVIGFTMLSHSDEHDLTHVHRVILQ
jgi:hypothetical protein